MVQNCGLKPYITQGPVAESGHCMQWLLLFSGAVALAKPANR
jgi:hypothetical protein